MLILVALPFHAFFTAWVASAVGHFDLLRIWKELLMFVICSAVGALLLLQPAVMRELARDRLIQLMAAYLAVIALLTLVGLWMHHVSAAAAIYGLLSDTRYVVFFMMIYVLYRLGGRLGDWRKLLLYPAAVVLVIGLLQLLVLPRGFLGHFGYGPATLPAFQTVDNKAGFLRLQSTLRGPNPLGAYLVIVAAGVVAAGLRSHGKRRVLLALMGVVMALVLVATYSRSAWLGAALTVPLTALWMIRSDRARKIIAWASAGVLVLATLLVLGLRHNGAFQNVAFHTSDQSRSLHSTNTERANALHSGIHDVVHNPLGSGVGSAGPASVRNRRAPTRIAENYFLQIGQEAGIVAMVLFTAITALLAWRLWPRRHEPLACVMLASLIGLTLVNFVSHAWADDTLAYIWWGLAAIALSQKPATLKHKHEEA
jgi:hypothetical protein